MVFPKFADWKFQDKYKNYIFQSLLTFVCMSFVLLLYDMLGGIIVASIGASSFILFVTPHTKASRAKNIVGGYICGAVSGMVFGLLHNYIAGFSFFGAHYALIFICAASSAVTTFLMISTKLVHPPAAALALGLSADPNCIMTAMAAVGGVTILCAARRLLSDNLKDLI